MGVEMRRTGGCICAVFSLAVIQAAAVAAPRLYARVVDVGAGLCVVIKLPSGEHVIYDTGNYVDRGRSCFAAIKALVPASKPIDLLVLSHSDADHVAATPDIVRRYRVLRAWHPGTRPGPSPSAAWRRALAALRAESRRGMVDMDLHRTPLPGGTLYRFGDAAVQVITGYGRPPSRWQLQNESERNNAGSIVVRVVFDNRAILLTGDSVGRNIGDASSACRAAEREVVDRRHQVPIWAQVLTAAHHGADNGSANCFIKHVAPSWVVFSAGHKHAHPRKAAALRFLAAGVKADHILRTDRHDDEGAKEWSYGRKVGHKDPRGDDDIEIIIEKDKPLRVRYRQP
ncbi:MAG: MBL fold metallo-hydrolase [Myxococcales bacterium]|nr:MBL fold metallo-hydrolase [Myxococcales bacterium]